MNNRPTHLVFGIFRQPVQTRHAEFKFTRLAEFTKACTERDEVGSRDGYGHVEHGEGEVVDAVEVSKG